MRTWTANIVLTTLVLIVLGAVYWQLQDVSPPPPTPRPTEELVGPPAPQPVTGSLEVTAAPLPLADFVQQVMDLCAYKASAARRTVLAAQIARTAEAVFPERTSAEAWVFLICIESKFDTNAKSSAGALGLAQLMPQYAGEFAKHCGLGAVETADLLLPEVNLTLGACWFANLLAAHGGNTALALAAYNSGSASATTKGLAALREGNRETANYIAKWLYLREATRTASAAPTQEVQQ